MTGRFDCGSTRQRSFWQREKIFVNTGGAWACRCIGAWATQARLGVLLGSRCLVLMKKTKKRTSKKRAVSVNSKSVRKIIWFLLRLFASIAFDDHTMPFDDFPPPSESPPSTMTENDEDE
ncbi:MAG: hypothetical protein IPM54_10445 [Polyangiaceae bacterium]|nr:hypothetical protein [Polyangiaceae bacterium]